MIFINYYVTDVNIVHIIQHIRNEEQIVSEFRIDKFKMECSLNIYQIDILLSIYGYFILIKYSILHLQLINYKS